MEKQEVALIRIKRSDMEVLQAFVLNHSARIGRRITVPDAFSMILEAAKPNLTDIPKENGS